MKRRREFVHSKQREHYLRARYGSLPDEGDSSDDSYDDYWNPTEPASDDDFLIQSICNRLIRDRLSRFPDRFPSGAGRAEGLAAEIRDGMHVPFAPDALMCQLSQRIRAVEGGLLFAVEDCLPSIKDIRRVLTGIWPVERKRDDSDLFLELFKRAAPVGMALLFSRFWLRPLGTWALPRGSVNKKIKSLVNHLFVKYPVPEFLYDNWICKRRDRFSDYGTHYTERSDLPVLKWAVWLILMGQGASLHKASRHFCWDISKSFESHLLRCPPMQTPVQAVMWAEIARLGGGTTEFNRLVANSSFIIDPTAQLERDDFLSFWRATVRWLTLHREAVTDAESRLILDWGMHRFTEARRGGAAPFSWSGRSPNRVAALALEYRESREKFRPGHDLQWQNRGWNWDYELPSGVKWSVVELVSGKELFEEGRWMQHCVGSYAHLCAAGQSAIFSLRRNSQRAITIELNPRSKRLFQIRGERNRGATDEELAIVDQWCKSVVNEKATTAP